jgi:hydroxymethylpyrimidine/phosphomethylpyrimidine kinase
VTPPVALTIAGSDSSGGAGVQADLKTFAAFGVYGTCAITAVTAQNTVGISAASALAADLVTAQIEAVAGDITIDAVKTGMLATAAIVEAVAAAVQALELPALVVDPVLVSKSGVRLLDNDGIEMMRAELLPLARVVTPNLPEAEVLSGVRIHSIEDRRRAAREIHAMGASAVVITGGHGEGPELLDLVFDGDLYTELRAARIDTPHTHGTGCTFASAVAARLARGDGLADAVARAQAFVAGAIRHAQGIGHGHGPLHHFWGGILKS